MEANNNQLPDGIQWPEDAKWKWFAVNGNGIGWFFTHKPVFVQVLGTWKMDSSCISIYAGNFPSLAADWKNSLTKRPDNA